MDNGTLTQWNRLETRPRKEDFSRTLRAEIRDPLWFMTRQWQMGELTAEDTGSPVTAKLFYSKRSLSKVHLGKETVIDFPEELPLETVVERENIQEIHRTGEEAFINDISLGLAFRKRVVALLKDAFTNPRQNELIKELNEHKDLQYEKVDDENAKTDFNVASVKVNHLLHEMNSALLTRTFHGGKLYSYLKAGKQLGTLFDGETSEERTSLNSIGKTAVEWFDKLFNQVGDEEKAAWQAKRLEYQYAVSAANGNDPIVLDSSEYHGGRLDWYSADLPKSTAGFSKDLTSDLDQQTITNEMDEVFPAEAEFVGMPHNRWWEFEDGKMNFGKIQPKKSDLSKILFAEFGLLFANDWSIMPLTMKFGSISEIKEIIIKDTFGQYTIAKHYKEDNDNKHWSFLQTHDQKQNLDKQDSRFLYIPPVVHDMMSSEALEKINFVRDEMANMVWGIETVIPDGLGQGIDGYHIARQIREYYNELGNPIPVPHENDAKIKYNLVTEAPENWIPFIPVKLQQAGLSRQIQLQRATMPRIIDGLEPMRIEPRTSLLLKEASPYFVYEEEIAKSGTYVSLHWQRTRMADGKTVVWLGRHRTNGRGEGFSNLTYDQIAPVKK